MVATVVDAHFSATKSKWRQYYDKKYTVIFPNDLKTGT